MCIETYAMLSGSFVLNTPIWFEWVLDFDLINNDYDVKLISRGVSALNTRYCRLN